VPLNDLLRNVADYVEQELDGGRTNVEVSPEVAARLRSLKPPAQPPPGIAPRRPLRPPLVAPQPPAAPSPAERRPPAPGDARQAAAGDPATAAPRGDLAAIARAVEQCKKCSLHETRKRTVPGQGAGTPEILFVGEAPGADEDRQGLAFVGAAGQLLTRMIEAMGYTRDQVFIANILKCRPPDNRVPLPEEMERCLPYLKEQIAILKPKVIVTLGATAARGLLGLTEGITRLRGKWLAFQDIPLMPTFHPSYLLHNPSAKREVWQDLQAVLKRLGRTPPPVPKRSP
jgi:uracil-DNA glycosylase